MKRLICVCLLSLGLSAAATAQSPAADAAAAEAAKRDAVAAKRDAAAAKRDVDEAKRDSEEAQRDTEEAKVRAELDKARAELDRAAREVAELSMKLGGNTRRDVLYIDGGPRRSMLGVQIDPESGKDGARVRSVSPGGPAEEAGLLTGDVIVALDGKTISGSEHSGRVLVEQMRAVKPEQKVKVRVLRQGKNKDLIVLARPMFGMTTRGPGDEQMFNIQLPDGGAMAGMRMGGDFPMVQDFRGFFRGEFEGLELASITPKLGAYFGASNGVLVVQAPENAAFKLEDGDVIQSIDGRKPDDGAHALRILRSYKSGEKLNLNVLRQRKSLTLAITMPERSDVMERFEFPAMPPSPPVPPLPPMAPMTGAPGAPGADT
jgi:C-terminal processing protease CtpA/Prc